MKKSLLIAAFLSVAALPATATIIDFEDVAVPSGTNDIGGDRTSGGFSFDSSTDHLHLVNDTAAFASHNGTTNLVADDFRGAATLTMSMVSGGAFNLLGFDIGEGVASEFASTVRVTGNFMGGGSIFSDIVLDGVFDGAGPLVDFQTEVLAGFTNLASVVFDATAGSADRYYSLDNIRVAAVPLPGALPLLLVALGGLGFAARRRKSG